LITGRLIALNDRKEKKGRRGGGRARRESRGGAARGGVGARKKKGRGEGRLTGGPRLSAPRGKKKKGRGKVGRRGRQAGPLGPKREPVRVLFFFLFLFQTSFSNQFSSQIQFKLFQTFLKNFIDLLETTQATKNHASPDDAHTLVVSKFIKLSLIFLELILNSNLISLNP
jgi:hypothetical protein